MNSIDTTAADTWGDIEDAAWKLAGLLNTSGQSVADALTDLFTALHPQADS